MSIKILSNDLINKIAAGEVVERPASIVKELLENSIDAKANKITIEIKNGGVDLIQITDNGVGIDKKDIEMSIIRHATSKIQSVDDLSHIQSFGFRGEALASISSVSKINIQSKKKDALSGAELVVEEEDIPTIQDVGCSEGTKVKITNIFYNIPARRKFLKNPATELKHILDTATNCALIYPQIAFQLIHNDRTIFNYYKKETWADRTKEVLGETNFKNLKYFDFEIGEMILQGFVSLPIVTRSNRDQQYLFVNNRPVYNNIISKAIYEAYSGQIPRNTYPIYILKLDLEPELVDVNVHPRKTEVKFQNPQAVFRSVMSAVRNTISVIPAQAGIQSPFSHPKQSECHPEFISGSHGNHNKIPLPPFPKGDKIKQALQFNRQIFHTNPQEETRSPKNYKILGQAKNCYIIVEKETGILFIDQHAVHERLLYDELIANLNKETYKGQQLLIPLKLELQVSEIEAVKNNTDVLKKLGFDIEEFGFNTIMVNSVPDILGQKKDIENILKNIISDIKEENTATNSLEEKQKKVLTYTACRGAIKAGDILSYEMQENITEAVIENKVKSTCPHGRPVYFELDWNEVEKRCKRK